MDKHTKHLLFTVFIEGPVFVGSVIGACYAGIILAYALAG